MKNQDIAYFLSFCIEQYKNAKGMDGAEVIDTFAKYDVFDYLNTHFEILHTQSRQWILEDIDEFIRTLALVCGNKPPKLKLRKSMIVKLLPQIEKTFDLLKLPPVLNEYSIRKLCENCNFSCFKLYLLTTISLYFLSSAR